MQKFNALIAQDLDRLGVAGALGEALTRIDPEGQRPIHLRCYSELDNVLFQKDMSVCLKRSMTISALISMCWTQTRLQQQELEFEEGSH